MSSCTTPSIVRGVCRSGSSFIEYITPAIMAGELMISG